MAFNPFHSFRKHKKVIFAILTIMCMFTFVLCGGFGGGDASEWLMRLIGGSSKQGEVVTTLYGDKVYDGEINERANLRNVANRFTRSAIEQGLGATTSEVTKFLKTTKPPTESGLARSFRLRIADILFDYYASLPPQFRPDERSEPLKDIFENDPSLQQRWTLAQQNQASRRTNRGVTVREHLDYLVTLRGLLLGKDMVDEVRLADGLLTQLGFELWASERQNANSGALIFGGTTRRQDVLDFMVWLKQADTLGINLTQADIRKALDLLSPQRPPLTGDKSKDQDSLVVEAARREAQISLPTLYRALADEFRVVLAQGIILGEEPGLFGKRPSGFRDPLGVTPAEYVAYFREQRRGSKVVLLPVPVQDFTSKVTKQPTEKQLEELYSNFSRDLPSPRSPLPGFKIPQKVRVQWIMDGKLGVDTVKAAAQVAPLGGFLASVEDPRTPVYHKRADAHLLTGIAATVGAAAGDPLGAVIGSRAASQGTTSSFLSAATHFLGAYESLNKFFEVPSLLQGDPALAYQTAMNLPTVLAATVGWTASGDTLGAALAFQGTATIRAEKFVEPFVQKERQKRARVVAGLVGESVGASPLNAVLPWAWAEGRDERGNWFAQEQLPLDRHVPLAVVKDQVIEMAIDKVIDQLRRSDLEDFEKKFRDAKGDEAEAKKVIAEAIQKMHLEHANGASLFDDDEHSMRKDPGLRPLRDALRGEGDSLAQRAFSLPGEYQLPKEEKNITSIEQFFYMTRHRIRTPRGEFMMWLTKNEPARTPSLTEARDTVIRAWKEREARALAREEAERIRKEIAGKSEKDAVAALEALLAKKPHWGQMVRLDNVTRQKTERVAASGDYTYLPYRIEEHEIEYPAEGLVDGLMKLKQGEAGVFKDRPEKYYYVAYMIESKPAPELATALNRDYRSGLWDQLSRKEREDKRKAILEELRRQAGKLDARGRFELNPGIKPDDASTSDE